MQAILYKEEGSADQLFIGEWPIPEPTTEEILVKVEATALNRADILQRQGKYPPPPGASPVLGLEIAGTVAEVGSGVSRWKTGDKVMALLAGGAYAQYAVVHQHLAMPVPDGWSFEKAAAVPEAYLTAWQALHLLAGVRPGEQVLIHAGASGVGAAATQIAKNLLGARVMATASAPKHDFCLKMGAETVVDYHNEDFAAKAAQWGGIDVIIDFIGAPYWQKNLDALRLDGRLVLLAMMGGVQFGGNDTMGQILRKRLHIMGSTLRNRTLDYKIDLVNSFWQAAGPAFAEALLQPPIDRVLHWSYVAAAHILMEANSNSGKIVLQVEH